MNGAPAKPISGTSPSAGDQQRDRRRRPARPASRSSGVIAATSAAVRIGCGDHRPDVGHDVEVDARRAQRHDDVGEQDGGVDAVAADRLQGDLGDQLGVEAGLHHRVLGPQRPVLGQRTAGLPHEPHRHTGWACGRRPRPDRATRAGHDGYSSAPMLPCSNTTARLRCPLPESASVKPHDHRRAGSVPGSGGGDERRHRPAGDRARPDPPAAAAGAVQLRARRRGPPSRDRRSSPSDPTATRSAG